MMRNVWCAAHLCLQNGLIHVSLSPTEDTTDGEGAADVCSVTPEEKSHTGGAM